MSLHIQIERFEGPIALLLHLIRKEEMNIFDINIHQITRQYLDYIKAMKKLDLELAGDFIAMAATLIHIKSKMLLPKYDEDGEEIEEDPREDLVRQLLEYEQYKQGGEKLYNRPLLGRNVFTRGRRVVLPKPDDEILIEEDKALFALIASYRWAVKKMKRTVYKVFEDLQSVSERILEIKERINKGKVLLRELLSPKLSKEKRVNQVLVTFLSLLELTRMGFISLFQTKNFSEIHIQNEKPIDERVVSLAQNYSGSEVGKDLEKAFGLETRPLSFSSELEEKEIESKEQTSDPLVNSATDEDILWEEGQLKKESLGEL